MKLTVCISLFDGIELLEDCVANYEKFCDEIIICYQTLSYTGEVDNTIEEKLQRFADRCVLLKYNTNTTNTIKNSERDKYTFMVRHAGKRGATHFIISAVDHFYKEGEVSKVKEEAMRYDATFTKIHTYYKDPHWQIDPPVLFVMPFICKFYDNTALKRIPNYPVVVDPACQISTYEKWKLFEREEITLHNYSNIRVDMWKKINNATMPLMWSTKKKTQIVNQFDNYTHNPTETLLYYNHGPKGVFTKEVSNYFNL